MHFNTWPQTRPPRAHAASVSSVYSTLGMSVLGGGWRLDKHPMMTQDGAVRSG